MNAFTQPKFLKISEEVATALRERKPLVALESTIITHGMPHPYNVATALTVEKVIRDQGAIPATIAVIDGKIRVGLTKAEIESLGQAKDAVKLSRDNLAAAVVQGRTGSTTVAATMLCARQAGIGIFATGGIGGVHRGNDMDISADLLEFMHSPVTVVAAGAKALLDVPKTLEYLETAGVPVVGYKSDEFAAFWSRSSGLKLQMHFDTVEEIAGFLSAREAFGLHQGVLISNAIPLESEIPAREMEEYIAEALQRALDQKITGKAVTPFLLKQIFEITQGKSLDANVALIKNNARVAGQLAIAVADLRAVTGTIPVLQSTSSHQP